MVSKDGQVTHLGYWSSERNFSREIPFFEGFEVVLGSQVICAVQILMDDEPSAAWVGYPDRIPETRKLATLCSAAALEAGFDVGNSGLSF